MSNRRVAWKGNIGLVSADHLTGQIKLRVIVADSIPAHGGRRIVIELSQSEAERLSHQLLSLVMGLSSRDPLISGSL